MGEGVGGDAGGVGGGQQDLIEVAHGGEQVGAALGVQLAEHVVQQQDRLVAGLRSMYSSSASLSASATLRCWPREP